MPAAEQSAPGVPRRRPTAKRLAGRRWQRLDRGASHPNSNQRNAANYVSSGFDHPQRCRTINPVLALINIAACTERPDEQRDTRFRGNVFLAVERITLKLFGRVVLI